MIRTGIVGYGLSGRVFHAPLIRFTDGLELKAIASSRQDEIHISYPSTSVCSTDELLTDNNIDLVVITSPNDTHFDLAAKALRHNKHVVIEKPMVLSIKEGKELISISEQNNRLLSVFHNRRWDSDFLTIQQLLSDKKLGELHTYKAHFHRYQQTVRAKWKLQKENGGVLFDLGSHLIDQALVLFGWPDQISSDIRNRRSETYCDYFQIKLYYPNLIVELSCDSLIPHSGPRYELHGDQASYFKSQTDVQEKQLSDGVTPEDKQFGMDPVAGELFLPNTQSPELIVNSRGCYQTYYQQLEKAIRNQHTLPVTARQGLGVIHLLWQLEQCSGQGITNTTHP